MVLAPRLNRLIPKQIRPFGIDALLLALILPYSNSLKSENSAVTLQRQEVNFLSYFLCTLVDYCYIR